MNFTQWRMQHQEFVRVAKSASASERAPLLRSLTTTAIRPNECYQNALRICSANPGANYVLGRVTVPGFGTIDHAWNSDEFGHFDATLESRPDFSDCVYQAVVTLTSDQVQEMTFMGMPPTVYEVFMAVQNEAA
jgi:hypothetical protein